jgi:hypothetical protein
MSRVIVFDLDGRSVGEVHANVSRGWGINAGSTATFALSAADAAAGWLQFGRMVLIAHETLPAWCGMIDTPWSALAPVQVTAYSAEYLLSIRSLDKELTLTGTTAAILKRLLEAANEAEDLRLRPGVMEDDAAHTEVFDQTTIWDQVVELVTGAGMELSFRPERNAAGNLVVYVDLAKAMGEETGIAIFDGRDGNMRVTAAEVSGDIVNRIIGVNDQSTASSRLATAPMVERASADTYRLRSQVVQYKGVTSLSELKAKAQLDLALNSAPWLKLTVSVRDAGATFQQLRLGNVMTVHASRLILPGGARGWRGRARITAMVFDEATNQVEIALEGAL